MARLNRTKYTREKSRRKHNETEPKLVAFKVSAPVPHQQLSLLAITVVLNTLLWTSILCCGIGIYQIASDSDDASNILPGVLILISVGVAFVIRHTSVVLTRTGYRDNSIYNRTHNILRQAKGIDLSAT